MTILTCVLRPPVIPTQLTSHKPVSNQKEVFSRFWGTLMKIKVLTKLPTMGKIKVCVSFRYKDKKGSVRVLRSVHSNVGTPEGLNCLCLVSGLTSKGLGTGFH